MLTKQEAERLAEWVNIHDGGVEQPRAHAVPTQSPEWWAVDIKSLGLQLLPGGGTKPFIGTDRVYSRRAAVVVLGY